MGGGEGGTGDRKSKIGCGCLRAYHNKSHTLDKKEIMITLSYSHLQETRIQSEDKNRLIKENQRNE